MVRSRKREQKDSNAGLYVTRPCPDNMLTRKQKAHKRSGGRLKSEEQQQQQAHTKSARGHQSRRVRLCVCLHVCLFVWLVRLACTRWPHVHTPPAQKRQQRMVRRRGPNQLSLCLQVCACARKVCFVCTFVCSFCLYAMASCTHLAHTEEATKDGKEAGPKPVVAVPAGLCMRAKGLFCLHVCLFVLLVRDGLMYAPRPHRRGNKGW